MVRYAIGGLLEAHVETSSVALDKVADHSGPQGVVRAE